MLGEFVDAYVRACITLGRMCQRTGVDAVCATRYTVKVVDVFAMPQSGTTVSVEAVDPVFQADMANMLSQTGRYVITSWLLRSHTHFSPFFSPEVVVGWYHSHPGFGCWLSATDVNTQQVRPGVHSWFNDCALWV